MTPFPAPSPEIANRYRAWISIRRAWLATLGTDTVEDAAQEALAHALLRRHVDILASLCPTSREDLAAQLHVYWIEHGPHWHDEDAHDLDDAEPQNRYVTLLWRAVTERDGWPRGRTDDEAGLQ
ncbi:MAG: hypothetical protein AAF264_09515 [Pseudomonadota bacterium]